MLDADIKLWYDTFHIFLRGLELLVVALLACCPLRLAQEDVRNAILTEHD